MISSTKIFDYSKDKTKRNIQMYYPLDHIYYAMVEGYESIVCEMNVNHKSKYIELITLPNYTFIDRIIYHNFEITKSLKEEIDSKNINVCLILKDGKEKKEITIEEIINIIKLTKLLENKSFDKLDSICMNITNKIIDLLGINVISNPSSNLKLNVIYENIIPAPKVSKLKDLLFSYIKISMILDEKVTISNDDYRILRALNVCRIKNLKENKFTLVGSSNGEINIECSNISNEFTKKLKLSNNK